MSNKDLYIIGAGDVGGFVSYHHREMGSFNVKGFLDNDKMKFGKQYYGLPVIGDTDVIMDTPKKISIVIAVAQPAIKRRIYSELKKNSLIEFPSFIHPQSWVGEKVNIGKGCIIYPGVSINYETAIADFVTVNMNAVLGHNCTLGDFSTLSPGVNCGGFTNIGQESFMGINSTSIQGITIGDHVIIGAGTVVIRDVPDGCTVVGNPGRIIKNSIFVE